METYEFEGKKYRKGKCLAGCPGKKGRLFIRAYSEEVWKERNNVAWDPDTSVFEAVEVPDFPMPQKATPKTTLTLDILDGYEDTGERREPKPHEPFASLQQDGRVCVVSLADPPSAPRIILRKLPEPKPKESDVFFVSESSFKTLLNPACTSMSLFCQKPPVPSGDGIRYIPVRLVPVDDAEAKR